MADEVKTIEYPEAASREMIEAGVFYGRKKSSTNPKMRPCVLMNRGGIEIINLAKTSEELERATAFLKERIKNGAQMLFVATQPAAEEGVKKLAERFQVPYVTNRWAGGTITNFKIISKRIEYLKKLRSDFASGALQKYTKKERLGLEDEMNHLKELFGGIELLMKEPDILITIDANLHMTAVREANRANIPVVALSNVDSDPDLINYLVPGNDNGRRSINWFLEKIAVAIEEGLVLRAAVAKQLLEESAAKQAAEVKVK
ncbi:MAG: 30S ribosomal protein S2 [Candidatus Liptonbacteria bacterium RIFCSPLOWO2_01_FULL_52_25]|uniref:Small ribosomal subunit protein uS2 n=1 Tax=Candidatus Liptonbacteria bacterium RIFCSPLOWO2_01_FULL_52_25 TaxID=1798650 RepID=A0A1G2CDX0_9BACT|nr:MAG: 30S ribosomal protein S2 [Candidatus Liptonbacteria bacterium RIFCSPLOWO2_01_FULL_52_25]